MRLPLLHLLRIRVRTQVTKGHQPLKRGREGQGLDPVPPPSMAAKAVRHGQASQVPQTSHTVRENLGYDVLQFLLELGDFVQELFDGVFVQGLAVLEPRHHARGQKETGHGRHAPEDCAAQGSHPVPAACGNPSLYQQLDDLLEVSPLVVAQGEPASESVGLHVGQREGSAVHHNLEGDLAQVNIGQQLLHDLGAADVDGLLEDQHVDVLVLGTPGQEEENRVPAAAQRGVDEDEVDGLGVGR